MTTSARDRAGAVIIIIARFAWVYPATYLPRLLSKRLRERDPYPPWHWPFVIAFTGVRGAVSLAAALALPLALPGGEGFPHRDLILFVSFGVILITLVGTGLCCRRWCDGLASRRPAATKSHAEHEAEIAARRSETCPSTCRGAIAEAAGDAVPYVLAAALCLLTLAATGTAGAPHDASSGRRR